MREQDVAEAPVDKAAATPEPAKDPRAKKDAAKVAPEPRAMRAMVFADAQLVSDRVLGTLALNQALVVDALKWLGTEEAFVGETTSEKDVAIEHTKSQDVAWFYSTILGAPLLVLSGGLAGVYRRRRKSGAGRKA